MIVRDHMNVYLKTADSCNLNCFHCFTSGSDAPVKYFNPDKTLSFFYRLQRTFPSIKNFKILYHGGEPMLAPLKDMYDIYNNTQNLFEDTHYGMQTNLVYKLTDEKRKFMKDVLYNDGFGTSWDYDIRFKNNKQLALWEKNVRTLTQEDDHKLTMIVSMSKKLIQEKEPIDIINYAIDLGFKYILFERITPDGNATINDQIMPSNKKQDAWLLKMLEQTLESKAYSHIGNMFLNEVAKSLLESVHSANRCRNCEQSLITINADGGISGCPNSAPRDVWGHIENSVEKSFSSTKRLDIISCESTRNPICYSCPVFDLCNGDCYKLKWEEDICAAPKSIFKYFKQNSNIKDTFKNLIF